MGVALCSKNPNDPRGKLAGFSILNSPLKTPSPLVKVSEKTCSVNTVGRERHQAVAEAVRRGKRLYGSQVFDFAWIDRQQEVAVGK